MAMTFSVRRVVYGKRVLACRGDEAWAVAGGTVWISHDAGARWERFVPLPVSPLHRAFARFDLLERLLRQDIRSLVELGDGALLAVGSGSVYRLTTEGCVETVFRIPRGATPLASGIAIDAGGAVYLGEYSGNKNRAHVSLHKSEDAGRTWDVVHVFPPGSIRHIHGVRYDRFTDALWVATGDRDEECYLWRSTNRGRTFEKVVGGGQSWRAVSLVFSERHVRWGTDMPGGHNAVMEWRRGDQALRRVAEVTGPVYYSKQIGDVALFSTAVERGEGDQDQYARIYALDASGRLHEAMKLLKDAWHPVLFGYGTIGFARGEAGSTRVWVFTYGLVGGARSLLLSWTGDDGRDGDEE